MGGLFPLMVCLQRMRANDAQNTKAALVKGKNPTTVFFVHCATMGHPCATHQLYKKWILHLSQETSCQNASPYVADKKSSKTKSKRITASKGTDITRTFPECNAGIVTFGFEPSAAAATVPTWKRVQLSAADKLEQEASTVENDSLRSSLFFVCSSAGNDKGESATDEIM